MYVADTLIAIEVLTLATGQKSKMYETVFTNFTFCVKRFIENELTVCHKKSTFANEYSKLRVVAINFLHYSIKIYGRAKKLCII